MSFTFSDQQDKLARLLGDDNTSSDDAFPLVDRKKELNRGEVQFAKDTKILLKKVTGTVSSKQIALPSDYVSTYVLVVNSKNFTNDKEISLQEYERYVNSGGDHFYIFGGTDGTIAINFINTNQESQAYILWYFSFPTTELTADTDVSSVPEFFREASVYYAASELLDQIGKTQLSIKHRTSYEALAREAQVYSEERYINRRLARPDIEDDLISEEPSPDIQGKYA